MGLQWNGSADNVGTTAYEIYMDDVLVDEVLFDAQYSSLDNFITVHHVPPGTTHTFTLKARDEAGNGSGITRCSRLLSDATPTTCGPLTGRETARRPATK